MLMWGKLNALRGKLTLLRSILVQLWFIHAVVVK